jgi:hypothetical protein
MNRRIWGLLLFAVVAGAVWVLGTGALRQSGRRRSDNAPIPATSPQAEADVQAHAWAQDLLRGVSTTGPGSSKAWSADFSTGNFRQWSWWGQGQSSIWGDIAVVNPTRVHIPALNSSDLHVAAMTVTPRGPADGKINAKLYKFFDTVNRSGVEHSPTNVSGTYSASYFIPSGFQVPRGDWSNIFQFKEQYPRADGENHSDPQWWLELANGAWSKTYSTAKWLTPKPTSPNQPVAVLNYWGNHWTRRVVFYTIPLNQWFQISAVVRQDRSIQFFINGRHFDTALQSQYHTGPFHAHSQAWFFGAGNYSTAPGNTLYLGGASYTPALVKESGKSGL